MRRRVDDSASKRPVRSRAFPPGGSLAAPPLSRAASPKRRTAAPQRLVNGAVIPPEGPPMDNIDQQPPDRPDPELLPPSPPENGDAHANGGAASDSFSRSLLNALYRFRDGDFSSRLPTDFVSIEGKIADVF